MTNLTFILFFTRGRQVHGRSTHLLWDTWKRLTLQAKPVCMSTCFPIHTLIAFTIFFTQTMAPQILLRCLPHQLKPKSFEQYNINSTCQTKPNEDWFLQCFQVAFAFIYSVVGLMSENVNISWTEGKLFMESRSFRTLRHAPSQGGFKQ
jgi:hypothetical protein